MWDDAFPSFLIGLREGLEAGLIVSILVATLVRSGQKARLPQVWTGVAAAVALALSFGSVLTFTAAKLSGSAQEAFGGTLSLIAVCFVTAMVFWMRKSARNLSSDIREKVTAALAMGAGTLILTSFLAVGREGLETSLFLWSTIQTADESTGPLVGAAVGLLLATGLCWALYRRVLKINLTKFFTWTGAVLIVIAAGVLSYGLRDLQESGVLPGGTAYAFDLGKHVDASSWYATLVQGVLNLTVTMTVIQVLAYVAYLSIVMTLFVQGVRMTAAVAKPAEAKPAPAESAAAAEAEPAAAEAETAAAAQETPAAAEEAPGKGGRPRWLVPAALVAVPVVVAGAVIAVSGGKPAGSSTVSVSEQDCGKGFAAPQPGQQVFQMHNTGSKTSEVYLVNPGSGAVYGEIEGLAPGTTRALTATIGSGDYAWRCVPTGGQIVTSASVHVSGGTAVKAVVPVAEGDLDAPLAAYRTFVGQGLATLLTQTQQLQSDIHAGNLDAARTDWLTAHTQYASLGAAYGTFADFDGKIDGRPDGLADKAQDKDFSGFLRLEYGLWHNQSADDLTPVADQLVSDVDGLGKAFPTQKFDPTDLPLRAHEILENALQFELTGDTDQGSGTNLATVQANVVGTKELLTVLQPLLRSRAPELLTEVDAGMIRINGLLDAAHHPDGSWTPVGQLTPTARRQLNGAAGQLLEDLANVPTLLEIRKAA
ncbi:iron uptake transporter permease EfeU [Saccharothrix sp. ST-888]|uniref:iron uptake transporter permease EfeU n=1 Tax=Saccharothrix sp. ST-888 TaxID=1427391 RepID=UPI0005EC1D44|nr:iron uptake transporter permease EfeU [Saccharothrix sp. ST-888]KJK59696.1 iron permease [Saccharothrix sp. ST-888]